MLPAGASASRRHIWLTPTVGGHIDLLRVLLVSGPWVFQLYQQGYEHALALDHQNYFEALRERRRSADVATEPSAPTPVDRPVDGKPQRSR